MYGDAEVEQKTGIGITRTADQIRFCLVLLLLRLIAVLTIELLFDPFTTRRGKNFDSLHGPGQVKCACSSSDQSIKYVDVNVKM